MIPQIRSIHRLARLLPAALLLSLTIPTALSARQTDPPLETVIVGGGPDPAYNQVAIESNVRYVDGLLPAAWPRRVLFADGRPDSKNVLYNQTAATPAKSSETVFQMLFEPSRSGGTAHLRAPNLRALNGPATANGIYAEFERLRTGPADGELALFFTGHGEGGRHDDFDNNLYDTWGDGTLSVRSLASLIGRLPDKKPVTLVMVQCFSGAFGNLIFEKGDPRTGVLAARPICGFFATTSERVAAGCTSEVDEAEYHDFTGSFFAALTGKDRLGRAVHATDFDGDGVIEMDEAMAWAEITEPSIDVPVCTSDVFLRRFVPASDSDIAGLPYSQVREWASPAQRAVMDRLSSDLHLDGESRLKTALAAVRFDATNTDYGERQRADTADVRQAERTLRHEKSALMLRFPGLRRVSDDYPVDTKTRSAVVALLAQRADIVNTVLKSDAVLADADAAAYAGDLRGARFLRLMRTAKTVVLEHRLRESGNVARIASFERLRALEHRNPFAASANTPKPPVSAP